MRKNENTHPDLIDLYSKFPYHERCKCGKEFTVYTQEDDNPEYYTYIHVLCDCGGLAHFDLPVN